MKKLILFFLIVTTIQLSAIQPPNPDPCLECDGEPWTAGTITYTFNGCTVTVNYYWRLCNGKSRPRIL